MAIRRPASVIVISSHVAYGGVGNRAAVFALERLGFPVVAVPTVVLPVHAGRGRFTRIVAAPADFAALLADIVRQVPPTASAVLSGYLAAPDQVDAVATLVASVKSRNPQALYLLDPILADDGRLYMPAALVAAMRDRLLPLADIVTPNRSELAFLAGSRFTDNAGLIAAARTLGAGEVVVTSAFATAGRTANLLVADGAAELVAHRAYSEAPHGVGDLLAALYLARRLAGKSPTDALVAASASTAALVERAIGDDADELPLAAGQDLLLSPGFDVDVTRFVAESAGR